MDGSGRSKREAYLAETFPPAPSVEGHAPGPFTERAVEYLSQPIPIELVRSGRRYIIVDAIEPNGNPVHEVVRFRFRLMPDATQWRVPSLGGVDEPIIGSTASVDYFHFRSGYAFQENVDNLLAFISDQLGEATELPLSSGASEDKAATLRPLRSPPGSRMAEAIMSRPDWSRAAMPFTMLLVGGLTGIALARSMTLPTATINAYYTAYVAGVFLALIWLNSMRGLLDSAAEPRDRPRGDAPREAEVLSGRDTSVPYRR